MKKDYKHPRFKAVELKSKNNLLAGSLRINEFGASDQGGNVTTAGDTDAPTFGPNNATAASKGASWSFDDDY